MTLFNNLNKLTEVFKWKPVMPWLADGRLFVKGHLLTANFGKLTHWATLTCLQNLNNIEQKLKLHFPQLPYLLSP